jgi:serine/threonine-protein kinase
VTPNNERAPMFSPDGKYYTYVSDEMGRDDIYVRRFPDDASPWIISAAGGTEPRWSPDGRELFYREGDRMMVVDIAEEEPFHSGPARELFRGEFTRDAFAVPNYDISSDGQRFLMIQGETPDTAHLEVILNWNTELKRLFAAER